MSKSMWIDAVNEKPVKSEKTDKFSVEVVYWREGENQPTWGYYNFEDHGWVDGRYRLIYSDSTVKYFAYIDNPYK